MAGYHGYSMSNNAVAAYYNGEKPYSKWTKSDILDEIPDNLKESAKKLTLSEIRSLFLKWTSWHHTSSMYNRTDFYSVCADGVTVNQIEFTIVQRQPKVKKAKPAAVKAQVQYGEWEGTRKHPKLVHKTSYAIIIDKWAYLPDKKIRTDRKHFTILATFDRAPKGTATIFKDIERSLS